MVPVGAVERNVKARGQVRVPVVFIARGAEPGSAKCAFGHYLLPPRRLAISIGNTGYPDKIPVAREVQPRFSRISMLPAGGGPPAPPEHGRASPLRSLPTGGLAKTRSPPALRCC